MRHRNRWFPIVGFVRTRRDEAEVDLKVLRHNYPTARVRIFERGVRAGGYTFRVFCAVAQQRPGEIDAVSQVPAMMARRASET